MVDPDSIFSRPCVKCGVVNRCPRGNCKACAKARDAARYARNPEKLKAVTAAWRNSQPKELHRAKYQQNKEVLKAQANAWNAKNRERIRINGAAWKAANPDRRSIHSQNRRARKGAANGRLSPGLAKRLYVLQKGRCPCCMEPLGEDYHLDHVMPLALGGSNIDDNMQLLRAVCNLKKHAKHPVDYMQERGFLI